MAGRRAGKAPKDHTGAIHAGMALLRSHVFYGRLISDGWTTAQPPLPRDGWVRLRIFRAWGGGHAYSLEVNHLRKAEPEEWAHAMAQAYLLGCLNLAEHGPVSALRATAADLLACDFLRQIPVGRRPHDRPAPVGSLPGQTLAELAQALADEPVLYKDLIRTVGMAGADQPSWVYAPDTPAPGAAQRQANDEAVARAIREAVVDAIEKAGEASRRNRGPGSSDPNGLAEQARRWFVAEYPLLASLASAFQIVEDPALCEAFDIAVAAVDPELRRIYVNTRYPWTPGTMRFVMAHELMHVGLRHEERRQGRDPWLWNVACDFVINGWLVEMGVGEFPGDGLLDRDLGFERESAEAIYDRIVGDLRMIRRLRKARSLRGQGLPDVLGERSPGWWRGAGSDLDAFYRRALAEGLELHGRQSGPRGLLPGDLVEEIRAIQQRPIPWDVQLGQWMDAFFPPIEAKRSFARASRRQSSTPDIPRPVWVRPEERRAARTFGVVLDTSGSMPTRLLARSLGAIASYALSREVEQVRVLQCDAGVHDMGYVETERLLQSVEVRGRGGTVLQPAVARLEADPRFPKGAPILVITDGACDALHVTREHAFLMPEGARLPFRTAAPQFRFETD